MQIVRIVLAVVSILVNTPVSAQSHRLIVRQVVVSTVGEQSALAIPENARLDRYPLMSGPLSTRQIAEIGLRPEILKKDWAGLNFDRKKSRFVFETIPAGDVVLVDKVTAEVVYREACGNRLVGEPPVDLAFVALPTFEPTSPRSQVEKFGDSAKKRAQGLWHGVGNIGRAVGWTALALVGWLILPTIVIMLGYLIYRRFR